MIAIKFGDLSDPKQLSGLIFLDAVTSWRKDFNGRMTEHPVEAGVSISDHFISENPKFTISGIMSSVDLSPIPFTVMVDGNIPSNANPPPIPVSVNNLGSGLTRFIPDSISQFLPSTTPSIIGAVLRQDHREAVETLLETIMNGVFYNEEKSRWENRMTLSTIYETDNGRLGKSYTDCVMTSYKVNEDLESGDALSVELSFEQVRFATSQSAEAPAPAKGSPEAKGTKPTTNKGTVTPTTTTPGSADAPKTDIPRSGDPIGTT